MEKSWNCVFEFLWEPCNSVFLSNSDSCVTCCIEIVLGLLFKHALYIVTLTNFSCFNQFDINLPLQIS